jgi:DNA-binding transcriptional LysR family regulator
VQETKYSMSFDWSHLRFFLAVARTGRLTTAAAQLSTDHATVSRRIAALEQALSARLFERSPRGSVLTPAGERLLSHVEQMENVAAKIQNDIAGSDLALSGAVRIGAPDGFGSSFLAPRIGELCRRYPGLDVQLIAMPRIFSLSKREADIAIGLTRPTEGRLVARKLTDYHLHLYASRAYLEAHRPIETSGDLADHLMIGYIPDLIFTPELDYLPQVPADLKVRLTSSNLIAQMRAAVAGTGVCVIPDFMAAAEPELVPVMADRITITRTFWLIMHADLKDTARIRAAATFIGEQVERNRALFMPG